jgi:hypothetical protein
MPPTASPASGKAQAACPNPGTAPERCPAGSRVISMTATCTSLNRARKGFTRR